MNFNIHSNSSKFKILLNKILIQNYMLNLVVTNKLQYKKHFIQMPDLKNINKLTPKTFKRRHLIKCLSLSITY
ncbi:hypothetical protein [Caloramator fervidus]|uniref:hypothetical protein n=1 Tax=Caloramator fervidus TaxID=29344 RepID=UPI0013579575|nr:hypothetical protein [Caloramator fervidus]